MPLEKILLRPGVDRENTTLMNKGGYYACEKIRFRSGSPEKIGGWNRLSNDTFLGTCRSLINWVTLTGQNLVGAGTTLKYYIEQGGAYNDITPIIHTQNYVNTASTAYSTLNGGITAVDTSLTVASGTTFAPSGVIKIGTEQIYFGSKSGNVLSVLTRGYNSTTAASHITLDPVGSSTVSMVDADADAVDTQFVIFAGASAIGGISATALTGEFQIMVMTAGTYYLTTTEFATSAVALGGGTITVQYEASPGLAIASQGGGWGTGAYGRGTYGSSSTQTVTSQLRIWAHDNFGEDLVFCQRDGQLYYWDATLGVTARGGVLSTLATAAGFDGAFVPSRVTSVLTSGVSRFIIALGANPYDPTNSATAFDPLMVRWSDQENPYQWVPAITNQSGEQRMANGSSIIAAVTTRQEILIWTDTSLYSMQYLGPPYVFGFNLLADNISIIGPKAVSVANGVAYWMGVDKFYMYSGRVETLPSTLRQYVFSDINKQQGFQTVCGTNEGFNEIWWHYCSSTATVPDRYVIYNHLERIWYYGTMARTAWLDSPIRPYPMAADTNNRILYHESVVDDESGTSAVAMESYIESSDFDIGDGQSFGFVGRMLPDLSFVGSTPPTGVNPQVVVTISPRVSSGAPYSSADAPVVERTASYPVEEYTGLVYTRLRGRQMKFKISSTGLGTKWQLGAFRVDSHKDGRR